MAVEGAEEPGAESAVGASPTTGEIFHVWLSLGWQSFGGGAATLALIRRACVDRRRWLTEEEFTHDWALVQLAPGINLLAFTILIGRRLAGAPGIVCTLAGLLLPSVTITIALTALYVHIQDLDLVRAALRGIVPATVGIGLLTAGQMARPLLAAGRKEGARSLLTALLLLFGSAAAAAVWRLPVVAILLGAGLLGALARRNFRPPDDAGKETA